jgi:uncharacterized protein (TIGR00730 family)
MKMKKRVAVFCGSSKGNDLSYAESCIELARLLHAGDTGLVYGGGNIGLMGVLADEMLRLGGEVIGVIPRKLVEIEVAHTGLTEMHIVNSMHERKARMMELADAFIIMPGGIGTLDEFFDVLTWKQLGYHSKNISILNIGNYFDPLISLLRTITEKGFISGNFTDSVIISSSPAGLLKKIL